MAIPWKCLPFWNAQHKLPDNHLINDTPTQCQFMLAMLHRLHEQAIYKYLCDYWRNKGWGAGVLFTTLGALDAGHMQHFAPILTGNHISDPQWGRDYWSHTLSGDSLEAQTMCCDRASTGGTAEWDWGGLSAVSDSARSFAYCLYAYEAKAVGGRESTRKMWIGI